MGEVLVTIGVEGEVAEVTEQRKPSVSVVGELPEASEERHPIASMIGKTLEPEKPVLVLPAVRRLAGELGVDISSVKGTGPEGRITEEDVRQSSVASKVIKARAVPKFDLYGYVERRLIRGVRRTTAKRMVVSLSKAAHVTSMDIVDVTDLVELREKEKAALQESRKIHLTYMPFVVKSVVEALKANPILNASFDEESEEVVLKKYYNIGFAVATDDGLIVPVVKGADQKSIVELAEEIEKLTELAHSRKMDLGDLKGGTFTITNYGVFGGTYGTPIINYPEVAILGMGKIIDTPLVVDREMKIRKVIHLSLSFDHRVMDGADAAKFMNTLKRFLEDPEFLLISMDSAE